MGLVCRDLDLDQKRYAPRAVLNWVSNCKNELLDPEAAAAKAQNHLERTFAECYTTYQERLREANALDFDDLIMTTVHLLQRVPGGARDLSPSLPPRARRRVPRHQPRPVRADPRAVWSGGHPSYCRRRPGRCRATTDRGTSAKPTTTAHAAPAELMVVGDADQSIYAFRGASIRNILQFEEDFPDAATILLEQNYRSTQTILEAANAVISQNNGRKPKRLWSEAGDGEKIVGYVADDEHDEAQFVAEEIDRLTDVRAARPGDVAVFYRTNAQSRVFEEVFIRVGLPYRVVGGVRFYERREVRDGLAYLRALVNPDDSVSLRRILNMPKRGIGDRAEACVEMLAQRTKTTFWEALRKAADAPEIVTRSLRNIEEFVAMIEGLQADGGRRCRPDDILDAVLQQSATCRCSRSRPTRRTRRGWRTSASWSRSLASSPTSREGATVDEFLERVALVADADQIPDDDEAGGVVTLDDVAHRQGTGVPRRLPHRARGRGLPARTLGR